MDDAITEEGAIEGVPDDNREIRYEYIGEPMVIANEFAEVHLTKVRTRNGIRLEILSPRLGYRIYVDALELESLSWQTDETFSRFLETPWGPG